MELQLRRFKQFCRIFLDVLINIEKAVEALYAGNNARNGASRYAAIVERGNKGLEVLILYLV